MASPLRSLDDPGALAFVDGLAVLAVLAAGIVQHHGVAGLTEPATLTPLLVSFLLGWYTLATLTGLYERAAAGGGRHSLRLVAATAVGAANAGILVRAHAFGDVPASPFPLVITAILLATTLGVRGLVALAVRTADSDSLGADERQTQD